MHNNPYGSVALVTGASSGIGYAVARSLRESGLTVYGTTRRSPAKNDPDGVTMLTMDVTDEASVSAAVGRIAQESGGVDILVNCAGIGIAGSVEDVSTAEAKGQFDANLFGAICVIQAVLPGMRANRRGLIVNISSVAGVIPIPFQSTYSASKAALEAVSEALRIELAPYGVRVASVLPGDTKTGFTDARVYAAKVKASAYREATMHAVSVMEHDERNGKPPETVAREVLRLVRKKNPPVSVTVGVGYKLLVFLRRLLPKRLILAIVGMIYCKKPK